MIEAHLDDSEIKYCKKGQPPMWTLSFTAKSGQEYRHDYGTEREAVNHLFQEFTQRDAEWDDDRDERPFALMQEDLECKAARRFVFMGEEWDIFDTEDRHE